MWHQQTPHEFQVHNDYRMGVLLLVTARANVMLLWEQLNVYVL